MYITLDEMKKLPFQFFQKTALLQARQLTDADYQLRNGIIQTREGPVGFEPGDYLARGIQDEEWPITRRHPQLCVKASSKQASRDLRSPFSIHRL
jgi:hypothetical protein